MTTTKGFSQFTTMPASNTWTLATAALSGGLVTAAYFSWKNKQPPKFPATQKKDDSDDAIEYPTYDYENDPKGSFMKICDMLIQDILKELPPNYDLPPRETAWLEKMLNYTVVGGKMNRGLMVVDAGKAMMPDADNTTLCRLAVLGWAIEWLQAWLLVLDDIMDSSVTRRGQPCWYKKLGSCTLL